MTVSNPAQRCAGAGMQSGSLRPPACHRAKGDDVRLLAYDQCRACGIGIKLRFPKLPGAVWKSEAPCWDGRGLLIFPQDIEEARWFFTIPFSLPDEIYINGRGGADKGCGRNKGECFQGADIEGLDVSERELDSACSGSARARCRYKRLKEHKSSVALGAGSPRGASGRAARFSARENESVAAR